MSQLGCIAAFCYIMFALTYEGIYFHRRFTVLYCAFYKNRKGDDIINYVYVLFP